MNRRHEAFHDAELVVDNLGQRSQAVRCAGSIGNNLHVLGVGVEVNTADKRGGFLILCRSGDNNLLSASLNMSGSLLGGAEHARGLHNVLRFNSAPRNLGRLLLSKNADLLAIDNELAVLSLYGAIEMTMHGVVFHHVNHIVEVDERIVDANDLKGLRLRNSGTEYQAANAAKAINANFNRHRTCTS